MEASHEGSVLLGYGFVIVVNQHSIVAIVSGLFSVD